MLSFNGLQGADRRFGLPAAVFAQQCGKRAGEFAHNGDHDGAAAGDGLDDLGAASLSGIGGDALEHALVAGGDVGWECSEGRRGASGGL